MPKVIEQLREMVPVMKAHGEKFPRYPNDNDFADAASLMERAAARLEFLEGLFDFSDEEIVSHTAPNDPVTAGAIVLRREHYEEVQAQRRAAIAAITTPTPL